MNKKGLIETLLVQQEALKKELQENIRTIHTMVDIDEEMTQDPEDYSHQYESSEMEQLIKVQLNKVTTGIDRLHQLKSIKNSTVCPGVVVETSLFNFFIGFAAMPFEFEGKQYFGVSTDSPIYTVMTGKKVGDSFSYAGNDYHIKNIY